MQSSEAIINFPFQKRKKKISDEANRESQEP